MANILELFNQKTVLDYQQNREYAPYLGESLFPETKQQGLDFKMIKGASKVPVIASVHAFDTPAEIGSREASSQDMSLALIKRKIGLKEQDIIALESPRNAAEQQYLMKQVYNDMDQMVNGVRSRVELMRMEALSKGTVTVAENNLNLTVNYNVPAANKQALSGTSMWTDAASDPINDLLRWAEGLPTIPTRALTSRTVLSTLLRHPKVLGALFGTGSGRVASRADLNNFLQSHDLPAIATYDAVYRQQNANGTYTQKRYFPNNAFVMFGDGPLGETIYGPTAEEIRLLRSPNVDASMVGKVLGMVYEESVDPVGTFTKAVATALPSFPAADEIFQATPIA